jgi:ribosomal protein S18 acetylase RimI-like enzyme
VIRAPRADELDEVAAFVARQQNTAALAVYERLGFERWSGAIGYRRPLGPRV